MVVAVNILSLIVAASGWYYLFYSRAAHRLVALEDRRLNQSRVRCRRASGGLLSIMGMLMFVGSQSRFEPEGHPRAFIAIWLIVLMLLLVIVVLAMIDLRLTLKIRHVRQSRLDNGPVDQ